VIIMKLATLLDASGLSVLDHLEREADIPVLDGLQAQGDLLVIPADLVHVVRLPRGVHLLPLPATGAELVRGVAGNNPHTLVADRDTCWWTAHAHDPLGLAIAVFENIAPAYLVHPEHGGTGIAPGRWIVRRQQERGNLAVRRLIAD
jgi:hypothetical protein